jgi:hypothetical protein
MTETRKLVAIVCSDVVGYSRLAGVDEDRILARLRTLRSDMIDPTIAVHHGRIVKRTGDGSIVELMTIQNSVRDWRAGPSQSTKWAPSLAPSLGFGMLRNGRFCIGRPRRR